MTQEQYQEIHQLRERLKRLEEMADGYARGSDAINNAFRRAAGVLPPEPEPEPEAPPEAPQAVIGSMDQGPRTLAPPEPPSLKIPGRSSSAAAFAGYTSKPLPGARGTGRTGTSRAPHYDD